MRPYAELLEFNQPNPFRKSGYTRIRDAFVLSDKRSVPDPEAIIEFAGRTDYGPKSTDKMGDRSIIGRWIASGHESMIEMGDATFYIECSRVVSHELVRHRLASFQQESQRFVKYQEEDEEDCFFEPYPFDKDARSAEHSGVMLDGYIEALDTYRELLNDGVPAQLARYVLPNAMRTRLIMKANMREWRHILKLRLHPSAQPEMQELMKQIYDQLIDVFPNVLAGVLDSGKEVR